jgi:hypothetical protein
MGKDKIICSGCSFTWGQGLWSYLETDKYIPGFYEYINGYPIPKEGEELREKLRWPHIVANHFNLEEVIKPNNGGTDNESLEFLNFLLNKNTNQYYRGHFGQYRKLDNCEWIIFQTTQLYRSPFKFTFRGQDYQIKSSPNLKNLTEIEKIEYIDDDIIYTPYEDFNIFYNWLIENGVQFESFEKRHQEHMINRIESDLREYSERGIKIGILCWTDEYLDVIKKSEFLSSKFINLEYNNITYDCIQTMQLKNEHLFLHKDPNILHDADRDAHPSKECHEIIAQNVIKYIKNHE